MSVGKQAGLVQTLSELRHFALFARTNDAFGKVEKAALVNLMKHDQMDYLKKVFTYHVVACKITTAGLKAGNGKVTIETQVNVEQSDRRLT